MGEKKTRTCRRIIHFSGPKSPVAVGPPRHWSHLSTCHHLVHSLSLSFYLFLHSLCSLSYRNIPRFNIIRLNITFIFSRKIIKKKVFCNFVLFLRSFRRRPFLLELMNLSIQIQKGDIYFKYLDHHDLIIVCIFKLFIIFVFSPFIK